MATNHHAIVDQIKTNVDHKTANIQNNLQLINFYNTSFKVIITGLYLNGYLLLNNKLVELDQSGGTESHRNLQVSVVAIVVKMFYAKFPAPSLSLKKFTLYCWPLPC